MNTLLGNILPEHVKCISNSNINENHLNRSQLHLNKRGTGAFAHDIIQFIRHEVLITLEVIKVHSQELVTFPKI